MDSAEAERLAGYLFSAALAGRATVRHWQSWADRMIEAGELDVWILDVSVAKTIDQLRTALDPFFPIERDPDAILGHAWRRYEVGELTLQECLRSAIQLIPSSSVRRVRDDLEHLLWMAEDESLDVTQSVIDILLERGSVQRAEEQWAVLFLDENLRH